MDTKKTQDIVKSNALVHAHFNPKDLNQVRVMLAAVRQISSSHDLDYTKRYFVSAKDIQEVAGLKDLNYRDLKNGADSLFKESILLTHEPNTQKELKKPLRANIISSAQYEEGEGRIGFRFTPEITPYLSSLKKHFTKYETKNVMHFKSAYAVRLYEICLQIQDADSTKKEYSIEDFREIFGLKKKYKAIKDLKLYVLDKAISDINNFSDIKVDVSYRKLGRRIAFLTFKIIQKRPKKLKPLSHLEWMQKHIVPTGFVRGCSQDEAIEKTKKQYTNYIKEFGDGHLQKDFLNPENDS